MTTYGSVCSGIEAASVAWEPLGMSPLWFSEIEPFPCSVLAHHWPNVPNLGDMTNLPALIRGGLIPAPDVLVGGTPCQAFSVAGARGGLGDARGQLTLTYVEILNAIDEQRPGDEAVCLWENVPGVLSSKDNAFGCFLAALCGEDEELQPPRKRWANAGCVFGPQRAVAWRVVDAQFFGVAQRRRRVFVVASARDGFDPGAVLFESEGVRRDTPPSREARQDAAADAGPGFAASGAGYWREGVGPLRAREQDSHESLAVIPTAETVGAMSASGGTEKKHGFGWGQQDWENGYCQPVAFGQNRQSGPVETSHALNAHSGPHGRLDFESETFLVQSVTGSVTHTLNTANNGKGCSEDGTGRGVPTIAFSCKDYGNDVQTEHAPTLRAMGSSDGRPNGGGQVAVAQGLAVRRLMPVECERLQGFPDGHTDVLHRGKPAADGPRYKAIGNSKAVPCVRWIGRRLLEQLP